jgi:hypothetical protein
MRGKVFSFVPAVKTTAQAVEWDSDGKLHVAEIPDDDPDRDPGYLRQPAHKFHWPEKWNHWSRRGACSRG